MIKSPHPALDLSFMCLRKEGGVVYWNVETTGSYSADYERGALLGREFLDYIGEYPTAFNATLLGCIVLDMEAHPAKGLKLGFMRSINDYAMGTAKILAVVDQA